MTHCNSFMIRFLFSLAVQSKVGGNECPNAARIWPQGSFRHHSITFCTDRSLTAEIASAYKTRSESISGGATLHTGTAAHSASSFPHLIHELHATCPHC